MLRTPVAALQAELSEASGFVYLARTVPDATAAKVEKLMKATPWPGSTPCKSRSAFTRPVNWPLLCSGWWALTGQGLSGLEYKYNALLEGKPGS